MVSKGQSFNYKIYIKNYKMETFHQQKQHMLGIQNDLWQKIYYKKCRKKAKSKYVNTIVMVSQSLKILEKKYFFFVALGDEGRPKMETKSAIS